MTDEKVETCIKKLRDKFGGYIDWNNEEKDALSFFGERYLHWLLYKMLKEEKIEVISGEWPAHVPNKKRRGHFDLAIGNWPQTPTIAIEFYYHPVTNKASPTLPERSFQFKEGKEHADKDRGKLCDRENNVSQAYMLYFILKFEGNKKYEGHKNNFKKYLGEMCHSKKLKILFVEVEVNRKEPDIKTWPDGWLK